MCGVEHLFGYIRRMTSTRRTGPIEVWISQSNLEVTCRVVHEDETVDELEVRSLSRRGAQRELTGYLLEQGYQPAGRWRLRGGRRVQPPVPT